MIQTVALIALLATPVAAADFEFCWEGANGYRMEGTMRIDDALLNRSILTEDDIGTFFIQGFKDDIALGAWDMSQMTPTTSWNLSFDPRGMVFPTGGMHDSDKGQAWNAGGRADDCGDPGFGFNSGTNAQDLCVNNVWHTANHAKRLAKIHLCMPGPMRQRDKNFLGAPLLFTHVIRNGGQAAHISMFVS